MKRLSCLIVIFLKGVLMGAADIVPGVSGGTIAVITGIYDRFISSLSSLRHLLRLQFRKIDFAFLLPLGAGILFAVIMLSGFISRAIQQAPGRTFAFFTGLIIVSVHSVFSVIRRHHPMNLLIASIGFAVSFAAASLSPQSHDHILLPVYFISGFIAVSAMMLPGISGSFMLLLMGTYWPVLDNIRKAAAFISGGNGDPWAFIPMLVLSMGIFTGLITVSGLIRASLQRHRDKTLAMLTGFILGALKKPLIEMSVSGDPVSLLLLFTAAGLICGAALELWGKFSLKDRPADNP